MSRPVRIVVAALLGVACVAGWAAHTEAAGPWRGQVVDAETGEPLEGVIVLAVWDKISPGMIHPRRDYYDVDEVLTNADGRFVIPERSRLTANPFVSIDGPNLVMFKPGYGEWRKRGSTGLTTKDETWHRMEKEGVLFEMPRLASREQRRSALPSRPGGVPHSRMSRFIEALNEERVFLGLPSLRRDGNVERR